MHAEEKGGVNSLSLTPRVGLINYATRMYASGLTRAFPRRDPHAVIAPPRLFEALGISRGEVLFARDYIVVLDSEKELRSLKPDMALLRELDGLGVVVSAPSETVDFVSRAFFPKIGIDEDPVTGSTHCALAPYWGGRLGRSQLTAHQLSERGGDLDCLVREDSVLLSGQARIFAKGEVLL